MFHITTPASQRRAEIVEYPRNWHQHEADEPQYARRPSDTQAFVHLDSEQRERGREDIAGQGVRAIGARSVHRAIEVHEVQGSGHENQQIAESEHDLCHHGTNSVHPGLRRPAEPEQRYRQADGSDHGKVEPLLGRDFAAVAELPRSCDLSPEDGAGEKDHEGAADQGADAQPEERKARGADAEAVRRGKDVGKSGKEA